VSRFRLFLVAGCLATAAASALSGFQLSLRAALVGAALVAAVLLLALRRDAVELSPAHTGPPETAPTEGSEAPGHQTRVPRRILRRRDTEALDARISAIARQLERYEEKLREMSRAQAVADLARNEELYDVRQQLARLHAVNEEQRATISSLHEQHAGQLARLRTTMNGQREAMASLESALETALATEPDSLATPATADAAP
jgi:hypothetical protein